MDEAGGTILFLLEISPGPSKQLKGRLHSCSLKVCGAQSRRPRGEDTAQMGFNSAGGWGGGGWGPAPSGPLEWQGHPPQVYLLGGRQVPIVLAATMATSPSCH